MSDDNEQVEQQTTVEEKEYHIKIPKNLPTCLIISVCVIVLLIVIYNLGIKAAYMEGFNTGKDQAISNSNDNEFAYGYVRCYLSTLGNIENTGWYIVKVENISDTTHWDFTGGFTSNDRIDDVVNSYAWKTIFINKKPLQITSSTKISDDSLYFIKNDTVWFKDK